MEEVTILRIIRDISGELCFYIDDPMLTFGDGTKEVSWPISLELRLAIDKELKNQSEEDEDIDGELTKTIQRAYEVWKDEYPDVE